MEVKTDSADHRYVELNMESGFVRVTYVEQGWTSTPAIRISIKDENGHLRQGPEIPVENIGDVVKATILLLTANE
ncbi:MAG: hypothetical protein ACM3MI_05870 [Clostridiales bacterium]